MVCEKLSSDGTLADRTELSVATIRRLMEACLECRYFQYQNEFYVQREGAPIGLSLSVVLANAYMEGLEEKLLTSSPLKPAIWRRYVDDTWVLWQHGDDALAEFLNRMNRIHESIQFTMEAETGGKLPFLDVLVTRNGSGGLDTEVYRKAIASNAYIPASSHHAHSIKCGIIKNMFDRARNVCSSASARQQEERKLKDIFAMNGYRSDFIRKASKDAAPTRATEPVAGDPTDPTGSSDSQISQSAQADLSPVTGQPTSPGSNQPSDSQISQSAQADLRPVTGQPTSPGPNQLRASQPSNSNRPRFISMPYVKGVSEPVSRFLRAHNVTVGHSFQNT